MFRDSSNGIEEYTTPVNKCIDNVVSTVTVSTYPHQKPWITGKHPQRAKRLELPLSRSGTLILTPIRNPAIPSDEPSNKQSVNTGLTSFGSLGR
jgi:hypothetical protein